MDRLNQLLADISNAFGPSGFEDDAVAVARRYAPAGADVQEDTLRNLYITPAGHDPAKPVVMLDAHTDEVGFMIQAVKPNGQLTFMPLGGWTGSTIPAHKVRIRNLKGALVTGVTASKPPHYLSAAEKNAPPSIEAMTIDVGASSAKEVAELFHIGPGCPVAPAVDYEYREINGIAMGKAFDCRAGCACALETLAQAEKESLAVSPVAALASQEEVGIRGATVTARRVKPAVAICFEGCPGDDTFGESWAQQTALKKGPMLRHFDNGMITNPRFMRFALDVAEKEGIPAQQAVRSGGSTNGRMIHLSGQGIPTIVIGIPVRYIHTHYGYAAMEDMQNAIALGQAVLRALTPEVIAGF